jgi:hypothetical protein
MLTPINGEVTFIINIASAWSASRFSTKNSDMGPPGRRTREHLTLCAYFCDSTDDYQACLSSYLHRSLLALFHSYFLYQLRGQLPRQTFAPPWHQQNSAPDWPQPYFTGAYSVARHV